MSFVSPLIRKLGIVAAYAELEYPLRATLCSADVVLRLKACMVVKWRVRRMKGAEKLESRSSVQVGSW